MSEFRRLIALARVGSESFRQHVAADAAERNALARRLDLVSLDRLDADVELVREPGGTILLSAAFVAEFSQPCIITLDPVAGSVGEQFRLRYGPPEAEETAPAGEDDPAFEPLEGESIDIGEAIAQEFSLALPPFPRAPDAIIAAEPEEDPEGAGAEGPFAVLAKLRRSEPR
jgi:uncharacterized metal-binding protein YceD (DUF177 family)